MENWINDTKHQSCSSSKIKKKRITDEFDDKENIVNRLQQKKAIYS